jgi:hypothetical protein
MRRLWEGAACTDLKQGCAREWLIQNGAGGYASQSLLGVSTRAQHSLLMAMTEKGELYSLLARLEDVVELPNDPNKRPLSTNEYPNAFWPEGYKSLTRISLDPWPTWVYSFGSCVIAKRIEASNTRNATRVTYYLLQGEPVTLRIKPLFSFRGQHQLRQKKDGVEYSFAYFRGALNVLPDGEPLPCVLHLGEASFHAAPDWFFHFVYQQERESNKPHEEDLFTPGEISISLSQEKPFSLWIIADLSPPPSTQITPTPSLAASATELPLFSGPLLIARQIARRKLLLSLRDELAHSAASFFGLDASKQFTIIPSLDAPSDALWQKMLALPGLCRATGRVKDGVILAQRLLEQAQQEEDILLGIWAASELHDDISALAPLALKRIETLLGDASFIERCAQSSSLAGLLYWALSWLLAYPHEQRESHQAICESLLAQRDKLSLQSVSSLWAFATPRSLFSGLDARPTLDRARAEWLTPRGMRDGAQILPWRLGLYCDAYLNAYGDNNAAAREHVEQCLLNLTSHIENEGVLGFISEQFSGDGSSSPGALTFAPSVAEVLRVLARIGIKE